MNKRTEAELTAVFVLLLTLLTLGISILLFAEKDSRISEKENRMLQGQPELSLAKLCDGTSMNEFESFLSDNFPRREEIIDLTAKLMSVFGEKQNNTAKLLAAEVDGDSAVTPETAAAPAESAEPDTVKPAESEPPSVNNIKAEVPDGSLWFINEDGTTNTVETIDGATLEYIAGVLNQYKACLPEDGTVSFINTPLSDYGNTVFRYHSHMDWDYNIDDIMQPLVEDGIYIYDTTEILRPYADERNMYSTEDHHWHVIAAWHVYRAMIGRLGYPATDFYEYSYLLRSNLSNGPFSPDVLEKMELEDEDLMYQQVNSPVNTWLIDHLTHKTESSVYDFTYHGYTIYLGGAKGPYRLFETGYHTGRNAFVIGDSFSFSLIPYLFPYYDKVLQTDFRNANYKTEQVGASAKQYMEEYGIDDVYIITCNGSPLNESLFTWRLETFLNSGSEKK